MLTDLGEGEVVRIGVPIERLDWAEVHSEFKIRHSPTEHDHS